MSKPDIKLIDGELNVTTYARNQSKMAAIEIRDHLARSTSYLAWYVTGYLILSCTRIGSIELRSK